MKNEFKFHKRLISIIIALAVIAGLQTVIYASEAGIEILGVSAAGNGSNLDVTVRFNADSADKQVMLVALPGDPGVISEDSLQNNVVWLKQFLPAKADPSDNFFTQSFSIDKPAVSPMNYTIYMSAKGASAKTYASVLFEEFVITYYDKDGTTLLGTERLSKNADLDADGTMKRKIAYASGYEFGGWVDISTGDNVTVAATSASVKATERRISFRVTYLDTDGKTKLFEEKLVDGTLLDKDKTAQNNVSCSPNYVFDGWVDESGVSVTHSRNRNMTVTATQAKASSGGSTGSGGGGGGGGVGTSTYRIIFKLNGGTGREQISVNRNGKITKPADPTKAGYIFGGWYADEDLTEEYDFDKPVTKSATVYAKWVEAEEGFSGEIPFTDVKADDYFFESVKKVYGMKLMNGVTEKTFEPNKTVSRGMFVTVLHRIENQPKAAGKTAFTDLDSGSYYADAVAWAVEKDIIKGISETVFAPEEQITREQMAAILYRYAEFKGKDISHNINLGFGDYTQISEYASDAVAWAVKNGIMKGNPNRNFAPQNGATRAEMATVIIRFLESEK